MGQIDFIMCSVSMFNKTDVRVCNCEDASQNYEAEIFIFALVFHTVGYLSSTNADIYDFVLKFSLEKVNFAFAKCSSSKHVRDAQCMEIAFTCLHDSQYCNGGFFLSSSTCVLALSLSSFSKLFGLFMLSANMRVSICVSVCQIVVTLQSKYAHSKASTHDSHFIYRL